MATKTVPIVGWDPNNDSGLVAWSCDCRSEANITAKGGTWTNNPARAFDAEKGVRVTAFTASSFLEFDWRSQVVGEQSFATGYQFSFEIETSKLVAYVANSLYFNGVNEVLGYQRLVSGRTTPGVSNGFDLDIRDQAFGEVSGVRFNADANDVDTDHLYAGTFSSYKKNFHTRVIIVRQGRIWQLWVEHQDTSGKRIGLSCLTRSGVDMLSTLDKSGMYYASRAAAPVMQFGGFNLFWSVFGSTRTALNTYIRNIQLVPYAPTQISHPTLRLMATSGDSYSDVLATPGNPPSPGKLATGFVGPSSTRSDFNVVDRCMARITHDTGINTFAMQACHAGGTTILNGYGPSRNFGLANPNKAYLTNEFSVPTATVWSANMAVAVGDYIRPITRNGFVYVVTASDGLAGAVEPTYSTTIGGVVTLDGVSYTCIDYDHDYVEAGSIRKGYAKPSLLLHLGGHNDSEYIQHNLNGSLPVYSGYSYANYSLMFEDLWKKWMKAVLDINPGMKVLIFTVPLSSPGLAIVFSVNTGVGRVPALTAMNAVYRAAPAYFQSLGTAYQNRVTTVDLQNMGSWNAIGDYPSDYPDGVHPTGERALEITANAMRIGILHMMRGGANSVL